MMKFFFFFYFCGIGLSIYLMWLFVLCIFSVVNFFMFFVWLFESFIFDLSYVDLDDFLVSMLSMVLILELLVVGCIKKWVCFFFLDSFWCMLIMVFILFGEGYILWFGLLFFLWMGGLDMSLEKGFYINKMV